MPRRHRRNFSIRTYAATPTPYTSYLWSRGDFFSMWGEETREVRVYVDGTLERYYECLSNSGRAYSPWARTNEVFWPPGHPAAKCIYRPWLVNRGEAT